MTQAAIPFILILPNMTSGCDSLVTKQQHEQDINQIKDVLAKIYTDLNQKLDQSEKPIILASANDFSVGKDTGWVEWIKYLLIPVFAFIEWAKPLINKAGEEIGKLWNETQKLGQQLLEATQQLGKLMGDFAMLLETVNQIKNTIDNVINPELAWAKDKIIQLYGIIDKLTIQVADLKIDLNQTKQIAIEANQKANNAINKYNDLANKYEQLKQDYEDLALFSEELANKYNELATHANQQDITILQLQLQNAVLNSQIVSVTSDLNSFKTVFNAKVVIIDQLWNDIAGLKNLMEVLLAQMQGAEEAYAELQAQLAQTKQEAYWAKNIAQIADQKATTAIGIAQNAGGGVGIGVVQQQISAATTNLQSQIAASQQAIGTIAASNTQTQQTINTIVSGNSSIQQTIDVLAQQVEDTENKATETEQKLNQFQQEQTSLWGSVYSAFGDLENNVSNLEKSIVKPQEFTAIALTVANGQIDTRVIPQSIQTRTDLEQTREQIRQQLTNTNNRVTNLEGQVENLEQRPVVTMPQVQLSVEQQLQNRLNQFSAQTTSLNNRVTNLEGQVENLEQRPVVTMPQVQLSVEQQLQNRLNQFSAQNYEQVQQMMVANNTNINLQIENLKARDEQIITYATTKHQQQQQQIEQINSQAPSGEWYTSLSNLWNTVDSNQNQTATKLEQLDTRVEDLENTPATNLTTLNTRLGNLENSIATNNQIDSQQSARIAQLAIAIAGAIDKNQEQDIKLGGIYTNLGNLSNTATDTNTKIRDLEQAVANAGSGTATLSPEATNQLQNSITNNVLNSVGLQINSMATPQQVRDAIAQNNGVITPQIRDAVSAAIVPALLGVRNMVTPDRLAAAAATGTCRTMQPGNCGSNAINNAVGNGTNAVLNGLERAGNAAGSAASIAAIPLLNQINTKLGVQISAGGIAGTIGRLYTKLAVDRWLNLINTALLVHNALMLSNNMLTTATEICDTALDIAGFKFADSEGNDVDFSTVVSHNFQSLVQGIVGQQQYQQLTTTFAKANRIYQASANILGNVRSIIDSSNNILENTGANVGIIGNALKEHGMIPDNAYNDMPEKMGKWNRWLNRLEGLDNAMDSLSSITSEIKSVQDDLKEIKDNKKEWQKAIDAVSKEQKDKKEVEEKKLYVLVPETTEEDEKESKE